VDFVERLRGMEKFDSMEALVEEMGRDADRARSILAASAA
ncbi:MAG: bifunctional riboflavin kinase/FAD synthetase, partial [Rhodococcus sp.]